MPLPKNDSRIRLLRTAFVEYHHADLSAARQFFLDFGLEICQETPGKEIFFNGDGTEAFVYRARQASSESFFGGAAYEVESRAELERATKIPGATAIEALEAPGGGEIVTLRDPAGWKVFLVHGQKSRDSANHNLQKLVVNYEDVKPRRGKFQRFKPGPISVHRWGHYGLTYSQGRYQEVYDWYTQTLALTPSDVVHKENRPSTCFFRIDRGLEFTDHHSFFIKPAKPQQKVNVAHAAFEVHDFDTQQLGHQYLQSKGYELCWGVGRHVLGSQVFDYWFDPSKFVVEHYADGDLLNSETPISHVPSGPEALSIWGPPVPAVF